MNSEPLRRALSAYERNDRVVFLASSTLATELGNADILPSLSSTMEVLATVQGDATTRDVAALRDQIRALAQAPGTLGELMAAREGLRTHLIFHQRTLQSARDILSLVGVDPSEEDPPYSPAWAAREEGSP